MYRFYIYPTEWWAEIRELLLLIRNISSKVRTIISLQVKRQSFFLSSTKERNTIKLSTLVVYRQRCTWEKRTPFSFSSLYFLVSFDHHYVCSCFIRSLLAVQTSNINAMNVLFLFVFVAGIFFDQAQVGYSNKKSTSEAGEKMLNLEWILSFCRALLLTVYENSSCVLSFTFMFMLHVERGRKRKREKGKTNLTTPTNISRSLNRGRQSK